MHKLDFKSASEREGCAAIVIPPHPPTVSPTQGHDAVQQHLGVSCWWTVSVCVVLMGGCRCVSGWVVHHLGRWVGGVGVCVCGGG